LKAGKFVAKYSSVSWKGKNQLIQILGLAVNPSVFAKLVRNLQTTTSELK
jgi:hypothetical protein